MARRGSNGVANNDETSQSLSVCNNQLEQLAKTVQNDCKDFPLEIQMEWKQQILLLAKKSAVVNNIANTAKNVRLEMRQRPRPEIAEDRESIEIVKKKMMKSLAERTSAFDANSTPLLRKLAGVLKIGNEEDEEDILLLNEENRESTFRCPYTTVRMVDPMTNGLCIHRISKVALASLLKKGKCLMPGCNAIWNAKNAKADPEFQAQMDLYFKEQATKAASSSSHARNLVGEDDGYSEL